MTLFCDGKDPAKERWEGARYMHHRYLKHVSFHSTPFRTGFHDAASIFRADDVRPIDQFSIHLKAILPSYSKVYADLPPTCTRRGLRGTGQSILEYLSPPIAARSEYDMLLESLTAKRKPLAAEVATLRAIKNEAEQRLMRAAADISGRAHAKAGTRASYMWISPNSTR